MSAELKVGMPYQGGIIAYILEERDHGYDANILHGLIAAPGDQSAGVEWGDNGVDTRANGLDTGSGKTNTDAIVKACGDNNAAGICKALDFGGFSDWYLPSKYELNKLFENRNEIGGFASAYYWSSSEASSYSAWYQFFDSGYQDYSSKFIKNHVRAVRSF